MIPLLPYPATNRELLRFAAIMASIFALIGGWIFWREGRYPVWAIITAGGFLVPGIALPRVLAPVYRLWMNLGHGLGWINTRIILGLMFFLVITPTGLFRRAIGKNGLQLSANPEQDTFASPCTERSPDHFNWQF